LRAHPPERRLRALARGEVAACCCTSSCCCCLHSVGSLAGAVIGSFYRRSMPALPGKEASSDGLRDDELGGPGAATPAGASAAPIYWWSTTAAMAIVLLVSMARYGPEGFPFGLGVVIFFLPLVLLGGSALCALAIAAHPDLQRDVGALKRLGWITLGIVAGALLGGFCMVPLFRH
jgi:hypothetical protein